MNCYGIDKVLQRINQDLQILANGIHLNINNHDYFIRGALTFVFAFVEIRWPLMSLRVLKLE